MLRRYVLLLTLWPALLHAQAPVEPATYGGSPPASYVEQLLASDDPRLHAWAAHFILQDARTSFLPALEKLASKTIAEKDENAARRALVAELDAIDQLGGELPTALIARIDRSMLPWKAHLLAGKPWDEALPVWQALYQPAAGEPDPQAKRLAAEMLARHQAPGFALQLLSSISVRATVSVRDDNSSYGVGYGSSCCGMGIGAEKLVWPPVGSYFWFEPVKPTDAPPVGATLFLAGASPVYLVRSVGAAYWPSSPCGRGLQALNDRNRSRLVGTLLGGSPVSPFPEEPVMVNISFTDREAYRAQVTSFVEAQQRNFDSVTQAVARAGLISEQERQHLALPITLHLVDYRKEPRADLPSISFREPVVWSAPAGFPF